MGSRGEAPTAPAPPPNYRTRRKRPKKEKKSGGRKTTKVWAMACFQGSCLGASPRPSPPPLPRDEEAMDVSAVEEDVNGVRVGPPKAARKSRFWMRKGKRTVPVVEASLSGSSSTGIEKDGTGEKQAERETVELSVLDPAVSVAVAGGGKPTLFRRFFAKVFGKKTRRTGLDPQPLEIEIIVDPDVSNPGRNRTSANHRSGVSGSPRPTDRDRPPSAMTASTSDGGLETFCPVFSTNCRLPAKPMAKPGETSSKATTTKEEASGYGKSRGPSLTVLVVVVFLVLTLVLGGRFFAILCTCTCFYLLPVFRAPTKKPAVRNTPRERKNNKAVEMDYDSEEYKRRVVLEGLLERRRKKPVVAIR